jgi:hypothetical protein
MSAQEVVAVTVAVLVPVVTAVAGVVSLLVQDWRVRRSSAGRRRLAFEDATRQVSRMVEGKATAPCHTGNAPGHRRSGAELAG